MLRNHQFKKPLTEHSTSFASLTALMIVLRETVREALVVNHRQQAQAYLNNVIADLEKIRILVANLNNNNKSSTGAVTITDDHFIQQLIAMYGLLKLTGSEHSQVNTSNLSSVSTVILEHSEQPQPQQRPPLQLTLTESIIPDESEWKDLCLSTTAVDLREHSPSNDYQM